LTNKTDSIPIHDAAQGDTKKHGVLRSVAWTPMRGAHVECSLCLDEAMPSGINSAMYKCPICDARAEACLDQLGTKTCAFLKHDHPDHSHQSYSGSSWPVETPDPSVKSDPAAPRARSISNAAMHDAFHDFLEKSVGTDPERRLRLLALLTCETIDMLGLSDLRKRVQMAELRMREFGLAKGSYIINEQSLVWKQAAALLCDLTGMTEAAWKVEDKAVESPAETPDAPEQGEAARGVPGTSEGAPRVAAPAPEETEEQRKTREAFLTNLLPAEDLSAVHADIRWRILHVPTGHFVAGKSGHISGVSDYDWLYPTVAEQAAAAWNMSDLNVRVVPEDNRISYHRGFLKGAASVPAHAKKDEIAAAEERTWKRAWGEFVSALRTRLTAIEEQSRSLQAEEQSIVQRRKNKESESKAVASLLGDFRQMPPMTREEKT
jgi:hypothetical protein